MSEPRPFGYVRDGGPDKTHVFQHAPFSEQTQLLCSTAPVYLYAQLRDAIQGEREACAALVKQMGDWTGGHGEPSTPSPSAMAEAIRSRS